MLESAASTFKTDENGPLIQTKQPAEPSKEGKLVSNKTPHQVCNPAYTMVLGGRVCAPAMQGCLLLLSEYIGWLLCDQTLLLQRTLETIAKRRLPPVASLSFAAQCTLCMGKGVIE
jgi:hypothetical protein